MALFKNYELLHDGIETGVLINGKTIDNYRPEEVAGLINSLPEPVQLMVKSKLQDAIMGDSGYAFDESRRAFGYQPDFTDLKKGLKKIKKLYLYAHKKKDNSYKLTDDEQKIFKYDGKTVDHNVDCPACSKRGIIGTEYCSVCWGRELIKVKSEVVVIPCDLKTYNKFKEHNITGFKTDEDERIGYPDWTPIKDIRNKTALSWDDLDDMC